MRPLASGAWWNPASVRGDQRPERRASRLARTAATAWRRGARRVHMVISSHACHAPYAGRGCAPVSRRRRSEQRAPVMTAHRPIPGHEKRRRGGGIGGDQPVERIPRPRLQQCGANDGSCRQRARAQVDAILQVAEHDIRGLVQTPDLQQVLKFKTDKLRAAPSNRRRSAHSAGSPDRTPGTSRSRPSTAGTPAPAAAAR